jgi:glycolate oxidase iron-sulfur subunit
MREQPRATAGSDFDLLHPPDPKIIERCVHCGFCLPACPTYVQSGREADSPRGRIYLMKAASDGTLRMSDGWVQHFDSCLGCVSCVTACPSGVEYGKLIEATRAQIERRYVRPPGDKLFRELLFAIFPHVGRLRWARAALSFYRRSGLQRLLTRLGLIARLPARLRALEALAPPMAAQTPVPERTPAQGTQRRRVGLVLGCVQREFLSRINAATARVLAAEGCEVVAPSEQPCCGALLHHSGEEPRALALARRMIDAFEGTDVDTIVVNAAGCGSTLKEYGRLLADDPHYAERAARFAERCQDVCEFLIELGPRAPRWPLPRRVAIHDPCHLQHAQGVRDQPRALLATIPELISCGLPEAALCCGSAGIYNLLQPEAADAMAERKAELVAELAPDTLATGNPGCLLQLSLALERRGVKVEVVHTIELLDAALTPPP